MFAGERLNFERDREVTNKRALLAYFAQRTKDAEAKAEKEEKEKRYQINTEPKVVLVGPKSGGKTCILNRYAYDEYGETKYPTDVGIGIKEEIVNETKVNVHLLGAGINKDLLEYYYRNAHTLVYVFDGAEEKLNEEAQIQAAFDFLRPHIKNGCHVHFVINKCDLAEEAKEDTGLKKRFEQFHRTLTDKVSTDSDFNGSRISLCSAKTGKGVNEIFATIAKSALKPPKPPIQEEVKRITPEEFISSIGEMKASLQRENHWTLYGARKTLKIAYLSEIDSLWKEYQGERTHNALVKCCKNAMNRFNINEQESILAGVIRHRLFDLLYNFDPSFVQEIQREHGVGHAYQSHSSSLL